ncbi:hypothetical protein [Phyllobacterium sp. UNC302MFCol5.2]|uniref:hypothetical protein n=1 Tax=Phyllobacterium sp. UNC302MFCol5.2 TaxID=1449065 RepID=UPI0004838D62|nr:hypothetical protein [Phyllobacterium sp. UNC302MFCol5.2]
MEVSEFIDTYSDDLINLHEARHALLTHPLGGHYAFSDHFDASFCRIMAVFMVGAIEAMLADWRRRDNASILDKYFENNVRNDDRVRNLYQAFRNAHIAVDEEVFNDYLAIKYVRNSIIHGKWNNHEREWLDQRGFPNDARKLTIDHLHKMDHTVQNMMLYIALTGLVDKTNSGQSPVASIAPTKPQKLVRLDELTTRRVDDPGIIKIRDLERIIWNNLERINSFLYRAIEETVTHAPYEWTAGKTIEDINCLKPSESKRLFYLAARHAGQDGYEELARHRGLAREALVFWREYWTRAVASNGVNEATIESSLVELAQTSDNLALDDAVNTGKLIYYAIPNIMPVTLLTLYLPIVDPENTERYLLESDRARQAFRLSRTWYTRMERNSTDHNVLDFYDQMRKEFSHLTSDRGS